MHVSSVPNHWLRRDYLAADSSCELQRRFLSDHLMPLYFSIGSEFWLKRFHKNLFHKSLCSQNVSDLLKRLQTFTRCFMSLDCRTLVNTISGWESVTLLACTFFYKLQLFVGWQFMFYIIYLPMPFSFFCRR